jgi:hypothetical protein
MGKVSDISHGKSNRRDKIKLFVRRKKKITNGTCEPILSGVLFDVNDEQLNTKGTIK